MSRYENQFTSLITADFLCLCFQISPHNLRCGIEPLGKNRGCLHRINDGKRGSCHAAARWSHVRGNGRWGNRVLWNRKWASSENDRQIEWGGSGYSWTTSRSEKDIVWAIWQVYQFGGEVAVISPDNAMDCIWYGIIFVHYVTILSLGGECRHWTVTRFHYRAIQNYEIVTGCWTAPFYSNTCQISRKAASTSTYGDTSCFDAIWLPLRYTLVAESVSHGIHSQNFSHALHCTNNSLNQSPLQPN